MAIPSESQSVSPSLPPEHLVPARILVAEDPFVSSFLRTVLQRRGHTVITCEASYASQLLSQGTMSADVVITNTPEAFLSFAGNLHMLYIAANPDLEMAEHFATCRILRKPFRNTELLEAVEGLADTVVH